MRIHVNIYIKKNVEIMAPLSGVQMLGRDSNGPHSDMRAFILNG